MSIQNKVHDPRFWTPRVARPGMLKIDLSAVRGNPSAVYAPFMGSFFPFWSRGNSTAAPSAFLNPVAGGLAMQGVSTFYGNGAGAGNTYALNQTAGTIICSVTAGHASSDGQTHYLAMFGADSYPGGPTLDFLKLNNGALFGGWYSGSDTRANGAITYAAGDVFTVAVTWAAGGTNVYGKGKLLGTTGTAPNTGNTAGAHITFGSLASRTSYWNANAQDGYHYCLVFDYAMTALEIAAIDCNPMLPFQPLIPVRSYAGPSSFPTGRSRLIQGENLWQPSAALAVALGSLVAIKRNKILKRRALFKGDVF